MSTNPLVKAVIFDLDGTLLDSLKDIATAMNRSLKAFGHPEHPIEAYKEFVGCGLNELVNRVLPEKHRTARDVKLLSKKFWDAYDIEWYLHTKAYPGVLYMIQSAVGRKIKLSILSNKPHYFTKKMIRHYFRGSMIRHSKNPFGIYLGEQIDKPMKPDPTTALELAVQMKTNPSMVAFVGDSIVDIQTAKNAGMIAIGAAWGFYGREVLEKAGADLIFDTPTDLANFLDEQPMF